MAHRRIHRGPGMGPKPAVAIQGFAVSGVPSGSSECTVLVAARRRQYVCLVGVQDTRVQQRHYKMTCRGQYSCKPMVGYLVSHKGKAITVVTGIKPGDMVRVITAKRQGRYASRI